MKKVLTILLALFMVLSFSGAVAADSEESGNFQVTYTAEEDEGYWTLQTGSAVTFTGGTSPLAAQTSTVTLKGIWGVNQYMKVTATDVTLKNTVTQDFVTLTASVNEATKTAGNYVSETTQMTTVTVNPGNLGNIKIGTWSGTLMYNIELADIVTTYSGIDITSTLAAA